MIHPITAEQIDRALDAAFETCFPPAKMRPRRNSTRVKYARCAEMGLTKASTARVLGVTRGTVHDAARRYGLTFKRHQPAPKVQKVAPPKPKVNPFITKMSEMAAAENAALRRASR
jgi:hypothetical protein